MFCRYIDNCFAAILSVSTGAGGCWWPISARVNRAQWAQWQFSNNPPNSALVDDSMTFIIILDYKCTGNFLGAFSVIDVWDFGPRRK